MVLKQPTRGKPALAACDEEKVRFANQVPGAKLALVEGVAQFRQLFVRVATTARTLKLLQQGFLPGSMEYQRGVVQTAQLALAELVRAQPRTRVAIVRLTKNEGAGEVPAMPSHLRGAWPCFYLTGCAP